MTGNNLNVNGAIKYHHNFIVTNSEEQFANERAQKEQLVQSNSNGVDKTQLIDESNAIKSNHSRANGSIVSAVSQSSEQSRASDSSSTNINNNDSSTFDLNLNMSASEMRKMLSQRKNRKIEAKKAQLDLRQKYEIIQQM